MKKNTAISDVVIVTQLRTHYYVRYGDSTTRERTIRSKTFPTITFLDTKAGFAPLMAIDFDGEEIITMRCEDFASMQSTTMDRMYPNHSDEYF